MFNKINDIPPKVSLTKKYETISSSKKIAEQQDNESINTMDYYKEEYPPKNNIDEKKIPISKKLNKQPSDINSKTFNENQHLKIIFQKKNNYQKSGGLYKDIKFMRNSPVFSHKIDKSFQKTFEDKKDNNDYCCRCNSKIEFAPKVCPHCLKPFCKKCLKDIFSRNLDNNDDNDNFSQNLLNEKICTNCGNLAALNEFLVLKSKRENKKINMINDSLDSESNKKEENKNIFKDLDKQYKEYNLFLIKIEEKKKEIEIKKKLNLNILQMLQKSIEYEYNLNLNKLNQMSSKIKNIQTIINNKRNKINQNKNLNRDSELQNLVVNLKKTTNTFSKNYEILNQKIILKSKPKTYKVYESKSLLINFTDTYCMKKTEILSNSQIGKAFIKVERFVNGYVNCLNFAVSISENNNNNVENKSKFVAHLVIDNKLIKLNKANKDTNNANLNYDCSLEEAQVFSIKEHSKGVNNLIKKDNFIVKLFITELFL